MHQQRASTNACTEWCTWCTYLSKRQICLQIFSLCIYIYIFIYIYIYIYIYVLYTSILLFLVICRVVRLCDALATMQQRRVSILTVLNHTVEISRGPTSYPTSIRRYESMVIGIASLRSGTVARPCSHTHGTIVRDRSRLTKSELRVALEETFSFSQNRRHIDRRRAYATRAT